MMVLCYKTPHLSNEHISPLEYVIPNLSDECCLPSLPCDLHVGELAPSSRQIYTSHAPIVARNGQVAEGDDPRSDSAMVEATVPVEDAPGHERTSSYAVYPDQCLPVDRLMLLDMVEVNAE